jgi:hypothetical protein
MLHQPKPAHRQTLDPHRYIPRQILADLFDNLPPHPIVSQDRIPKPNDDRFHDDASASLLTDA